MSTPSLKSNFIYKSLLTISSYVINLLIFPYISRVLEVDDVGLVNFVDNTISLFILFAAWGINILGAREIASVKNDYDERSRAFANLLGVNLLFTIIVVIGYLIAISCVDSFHQNAQLFYIGLSKIIATAFMVEWLYNGMEDFKFITIRSIIIKIFYIILVFCCVRSSEDYYVYFILTISVVVFNAIINMIHVRSYVKIILKELFNIRRYIRRDIILGVYSIMTSMYLTLNVTFLGIVSNNTEVGYYTTAFKLYSVIVGLLSSFSSVLFPRMTKYIASNDMDLFDRVIKKSFSIMATLCIPLVICTIIMSPQLVYAFAGAGYEGSILPMRIIMPAIFFVAISQVLAMLTLAPYKKDKVLLLASSLGGIMGLILALITVPKSGSVGAAIVLVGSELVVSLTYVIYVSKTGLVRLSYAPILKSLIKSVPCAIICLCCSCAISNQLICLGAALSLTSICWAMFNKPFIKELRNRI